MTPTGSEKGYLTAEGAFSHGGPDFESDPHDGSPIKGFCRDIDHAKLAIDLYLDGVRKKTSQTAETLITIPPDGEVVAGDLVICKGLNIYRNIGDKYALVAGDGPLTLPINSPVRIAPVGTKVSIEIKENK